MGDQDDDDEDEDEDDESNELFILQGLEETRTPLWITTVSSPSQKLLNYLRNTGWTLNCTVMTQNLILKLLK